MDVRAFPASRRHPQFAKESLAQSLRDAGIAYDWQGKALGGFRRGPYSEHMKTAAFRDAAAALAMLPGRVCIMCAETRPEDCHRAHISEWLVRRGHRVMHLIAPARMHEHAVHPQEDLWPDV